MKKTSNSLLSTLVALTATGAFAQLPAVTTVNQPYTSITGGQAVVFTDGTPPGDEDGVLIPIGFPFPYFGRTYTHVMINTNGVLVLGDATQTACDRTGCHTSYSLPSPNAAVFGPALIAGIWDDHDFSKGGSVQYLRAPEGLVIEYKDAPRFERNGTRVTFKVTLSPSGTFTIHHGPVQNMVTDGGFRAAVGFQSEKGYAADGGNIGRNLLAGCTNNCSTQITPDRLFRINEPDEADLGISNVTYATPRIESDGRLTVDLTALLRNYGRTSAETTWRAYLSTTGTLDAGNDGGSVVEFAEQGPITLEAVDGGFAEDGGFVIRALTASLTTPSAVPFGEYFVLVQANSNGAVPELNFDNNVDRAPASFTHGVDVQAVRISGPDAGYTGAPMQVDVTVRNRGTFAVDGVPFRVTLSADLDAGPEDVVVFTGTQSLDAGETVSRTLAFNLPATTPSGTFYWGLQLNAGGTPIVEINPSNNLVFSTSRINVDRSDLALLSASIVDPGTDLPTTVGRFGEPVRGRIRIRNEGPVSAANFRVALVLSNDSTLSLLSDTYVCDTAVPLLASGASLDVVVECNLPLKDRAMMPFPTGTYYLWAVVDALTAVSELNEANNTLVVGPLVFTAPGVDLKVLGVSAPSTSGAGELLPVSRSIGNVGNVGSPMTAYRYYASANTIITTSDVLLPIANADGTTVDQGMLQLDAGVSSTTTEVLRVPASLAAGTYFIGCIVDPQGALSGELDRTNNQLASRQVVISQGALAVDSAVLPDAIAGRPYAYRLAARGVSGAVSWSIDRSLGDAPAWLTVSATDGLLSGTPPADSQAQVVGLTVRVESGGRSAVARLAMRVLPNTAALEISTAGVPSVVNSSNVQYVYALGAVGGVQPYAWRVVSGTLPTGLAVSNEGVLSGAPRGAANGTTSITVEVADAVGARAQKTFALRLIAAGAITFRTLSIPDALVGQDYLQDIAVANQDNSALARPLTWSVSGRLPPGLTAMPSAELMTIGGTPTQAGLFTFTISVADTNGRTDSLEYSMTVSDAPYQVSAEVPEVARPGEPLTIPLAVSPQAQVTYRIVNGSLPPGLALSGSEISGTIEADGTVGSWPFMVEARDANGRSGVAPFTLKVERAPRASGCSSTSAEWSPLAAMAVLALLFGRSRSPRPGNGLRSSGGWVGALAAVALVLPSLANAQAYQLVGPTPATYTPLTNGAVVSISPPTPITLPFPVPFFDTTISTVTISQYGYLAVGSSYAQDSTNEAIPDSSASTVSPSSLIAPWWDSLTTAQSTSNGYRYLISGTAPNRVIAFEWFQVGANTTSARVNFQAHLYETTGRIRFVYGAALPATSVSASVGVQKVENVGVPGLGCTSSSNCGSTQFPAGQAIDFYLPPELEVTTLSAPALGYAGVVLPLTATVRNTGGRDVTNVTVRFYLSTDATFSATTDTAIGSATIGSIPFLGTAQATLANPLPSTLSQSNYFVIAVVDPDAAIAERVENNNASAPSALTIGPPTADLQLTGFTSPTMAAPGATVSVSRSVQNVGNARSVGVGVALYLSDNASVSIADRVLSTGTVGALDAAQVDTQSAMVTIPSTLTPGTYWLGACVNVDTATTSFGSGEITVVNNCLTATTPIVVSTSTVAVATNSLPMATQYAPVGAGLTATGGNGQYTWALMSGALPPGVSLSAAGDLVGTPSVAGSFTFEVKVTSNGASATAMLTLTVAPGGLPLVIVDQTLSSAQFGRGYQVGLVAVGGKPPYTWSAVDPEELPPGMAIATDGLLEGRASSAGEFAFDARVTDSAGVMATKSFVLRVVTPNALAIATTSLQQAFVGRDYQQSLTAVGGTAPYRWSLVRVQQLAQSVTEAPGPVLTELPQGFGVTVDDGDLVDSLRGNPKQAGLYVLTLKVTDGADTEDTATFLFDVTYRDGLAITTTQLPDGFQEQPYQVKLTHNGGAEASGLRFSVACVQEAKRPGEYACNTQSAAQALPAGLELREDGTLLGTPTGSVGTSAFLVKLTDALGRQDVRALSIRVRDDFEVQQTSGCTSVSVISGAWVLALAALARSRRRR